MAEPQDIATSGALAGRTIAIPETRELEVFASMLERRGATVLRCPLVAIRDAPDPQPVLAWCQAIRSRRVRRPHAAHRRRPAPPPELHRPHEPALRAPFIAQLAAARKITRGPKPAKVLRELGLKPDIAAETPTTDGVITSLAAHALNGRRFGLQLYGTEPNRPLVEFLENAGATVSTVAPYVYADEADDDAVRALLNRLQAGAIDAIAFTSTPQVDASLRPRRCGT